MPSRSKRNGSAQVQATAAPPCENDIRFRAYEIFVARGEQPGGDLDDWLQAERELGGLAAKSLALRQNGD